MTATIETATGVPDSDEVMVFLERFVELAPEAATQVLSHGRNKSIMLEVSPELAALFLTRNRDNRRLSRRYMSGLVSDMRAGRYVFNGATMCFDWDWWFFDGQHRAAAIVEAEVTAPCLVVFGLQPEARLVTDTGHVRTAAHTLTFLGEHNEQGLSAIVRLALLYETKRLRAPQVTRSEIVEFLTRDPEPLRQAATFARANTRKVGVSASVTGTAWWVLHRVEPESCDEFFWRLTSLVGLTERDPIRALHNRLSSFRSSKEAAVSAQLLHLLLKAWMSWRRGSSLQRLSMPSLSDPLPDYRDLVAATSRPFVSSRPANTGE